MGMTNEDAKKMLEAKLKCFIAETSGTNHDCNMRLCEGCALNYEQGNMGEQKQALDMAIKALEQQPRWIPVSERLPEVMYGSNGECSDDVLICVIDDENITISTGFYGYYPNSNSEQGWWSVWAYGCHKLDSKYKVVAWMPLPQPYVPDTNVGEMGESEDEE